MNLNVSKKDPFVRGVKARMPHDKVKHFIVTKLAITEEVIKEYEKHKNEKGYWNLEVKIGESKEGDNKGEKYHYVDHDDFVPDGSKSNKEDKGQSMNPENIPF